MSGWRKRQVMDMALIKDEALKLALEALELVNMEFVCGNGSHHKKEDRHEWDEDCPIMDRWRKAIAAIKEALAQEKALQALHNENERLGLYKDAYAQPEPVAWMFQHEETGRTMCVDSQQVEWGFEKGNPRLKKVAPLYTSPPPQRKETEQEPVAWVDLLEEAQQIVESKVLWKRFIDGTPLSNDIACWMAAFAQQHITPPQRTWVGLIRGVRVEGDSVIITVKNGNDAARELCGEIINEMEINK